VTIAARLHVVLPRLAEPRHVSAATGAYGESKSALDAVVCRGGKAEVVLGAASFVGARADRLDPRAPG